MTIIKDARGTGNTLGVDSQGRLDTNASTELRSGDKSRQGELFGMGTGRLTLPAGFNGRVLHVRNDSQIRNFHVTKLIFGNDGGNGNDHTVFSLIFYNDTTPTTNVATAAASNENKTSSRIADLTVLKWDEVGSSGMTVFTAGEAQIPNTVGPGNTSLPIDGEIIFGPDQTMNFDIAASAAVKFHVSMVGYFEDT